MTKAKKKKTEQKKPSHIIRAFLFLCVVIVLFFIFVDQNNLPKGLQDNGIMAKGYELKDKALPKKQTAEKKNKKPATTGYSAKDRATMDQLISKGAEDY